MKILGFISLLVWVVACDPYGFGFKRNPAYVLDETFKAISNQDRDTFIEMTSKEVLCTYGNPEGLQYLKEQLGTLNVEDIKIEPKKLDSTYFSDAQFVGFWAYYTERYQIDITDKRDAQLVIKAIVDCEYGTDGEKDASLLRLNPKQYKKRDCQLSKVIPAKFKGLPLPAKCSNLKINL